MQHDEFLYLLKDDVNLFDYNVQERVNDFVAAALSQVSSTRSSRECQIACSEQSAFIFCDNNQVEGRNVN